MYVRRAVNDESIFCDGGEERFYFCVNNWWFIYLHVDLRSSKDGIACTDQTKVRLQASSKLALTYCVRCNAPTRIYTSSPVVSSRYINSIKSEA